MIVSELLHFFMNMSPMTKVLVGYRVSQILKKVIVCVIYDKDLICLVLGFGMCLLLMTRIKQGCVFLMFYAKFVN